MNRTKFHAGLALSSAVLLLLAVGCKRNHPPSIPDMTGQKMYRPGDTARLSATSTDLDNDSVSYLFAWVDSSSAVWTSSYPSGVVVTGSHVYAESGAYEVRAKAKDDKDAESDWSGAETLRVGLFPPGIPAVPSGPTVGRIDTAYAFKTSTTSPFGESIRVQFDWGGTSGAWRGPFASGTACTDSHTFGTVGRYRIRARAQDKAGVISAWSDTAVAVMKKDDTIPPVVRIVAPASGQALPMGRIAVKAIATDNKAMARVEFYVDSLLLGTDSIGGAGDTYRCVWSAPQATGQSYQLVAKAYDTSQNYSSATITATIGSGVKWYWLSPTDSGPITSTVIVANDGADEVIMGCCLGEQKFYSMRARDGYVKSGAIPEGDYASFVSDPGLLTSRGHIIVGDDDGFLYALTPINLNTDWTWPDTASGIEWGAPALSGNDIYIGHDDTSLYHFVDNGSSVTVAGVYTFGDASVVDAPVVDAAGDVIVGTDSGYLYKFDANLTAPIWRTHLIQIGEVNGVIIGNDGTIYCGSDSAFTYAIDPSSGHVKWTTPLDAPGIRPVLGRSALFVGSDAGTFYSINPLTGSVNWQQRLSPGFGFETAPIVAANGYIYAQNTNDVLYCLNQADCTLIWSCDCISYLPLGRSHRARRPRKVGLTENVPNPSITSTGDIIVVGGDALYCVGGYTAGPLDPAAAWPKWQKDLANSGRK